MISLAHTHTPFFGQISARFRRCCGGRFAGSRICRFASNSSFHFETVCLSLKRYVHRRSRLGDAVSPFARRVNIILDNAGAIVAPDALARAAKLGVSASASLADNDGYGFFKTLGDLAVTGPTHTNVNDFRAIVIA